MSQRESSDGQEHGDRARCRSGWPMRPSGVCATMCFTQNSEPTRPAVCVPSVSTGPGLMRVDADLPRAELAREHAGDGVHRALAWPSRRPSSAGVRRVTAGADVDDAAALAEVLDGGLRGEQAAEHVDVEDPVEVLLGDRLERREGVDAGVVDQDVEAAIGLDRGVDDCPAPRRPWRRRRHGYRRAAGRR